MNPFAHWDREKSTHLDCLSGIRHTSESSDAPQLHVETREVLVGGDWSENVVFIEH